ncbi:uncharacterized protein LOC103699836 [Phoenix dactylifera]|uniref:Uncharacterized protein LOC103699836 n=1 Tax=Phoenix dactylifera TaxID=42345 RepID=A0A8B9AT71_PHODC|nr:uncharacterized protein LOC103699836 [Phoenix dactylifera]
MHQITLSLQDLFHEENLCNSTGLCLDESLLCRISLNKFSSETEENTCLACRKSVKNIFIQLKAPKLRMKIMETLIENCKEADENEEQCKQIVCMYVPLILSKLDKQKPSDRCRLMNLYDEGISL